MNILEAIEAKDGKKFLKILDKGFKKAARAASQESHALGLTVVDGKRDAAKADPDE
jgi:hypothetical protein